MSSWNYRILYIPNKYEDCEYGLYEVYYDDDEEPYARMATPLFVGNSEREVQRSVQLALEGTMRPTLHGFKESNNA